MHCGFFTSLENHEVFKSEGEETQLDTSGTLIRVERKKVGNAIIRKNEQKIPDGSMAQPLNQLTSLLLFV
jgi:hypothetical protein